MQDNNELSTEKRKGYSPAETAAVKEATISGIVKLQTALMERAPEKTDLSDLKAVRQVANACMQKCADAGVLPNFEALAAALGYSRRGLYFYIEQRPDSETTIYIDRLRTSWAAMRQMAADRGAVGETMSIFVLLNSSLGFTNQHSIEIVQPASPLEQMDTESARKKLIEAIPFDDDDNN